MQDRSESRPQAVERLRGARERHARRSEQYKAAAGSSRELSALTELKAAEEQFAAREAWLKWIDRDY
jgi:hypothetical protein